MHVGVGVWAYKYSASSDPEADATGELCMMCNLAHAPDCVACVWSACPCVCVCVRACSELASDLVQTLLGVALMRLPETVMPCPAGIAIHADPAAVNGAPPELYPLVAPLECTHAPYHLQLV